MKEFKVYVLIDPISLKIRYVGITKSSLSNRLYNHISEAKTLREGMTYKNNWIRSILKNNSKPYIRLLTSFDTREESAKIERNLIIKYKDSHRLTNQIVDEGKFTSEGSKSAYNLKSKKIYVYKYDGTFFKEYSCIKDCSKELGIYYKNIFRAIKGEYNHCKTYQFSYTKEDKLQDLNNYSKGNWVDFELLNTKTEEIIKYLKMTDLIKDLNLNVKTSSVKTVLGALNKQYGNSYKLKINGEWKFSTYYNTGVQIILNDNTTEFYKTKQELARKVGLKGGFTQKQLDKFLELKYTNNIKQILYNLCPLE